MQEEESWAKESLREIALEGIRERRRARRWGIFFKLLVLAYFGVLLVAVVMPGLQWGAEALPGEHTAVVRIHGPLTSDGEASDKRIIQGLEAAFAAQQSKGILLDINSPGGSPVISSRIYAAIQRLRAEHPNKPVHAVAGDVMASGAYYIAAAADAIHVDGASVVGSIGVVSRGFGLADAIERLGIERRIFTAGEEKAGLDPFTTPDEKQINNLQIMLHQIHEQFIAAVEGGRGDRLQGDREVLFSGRIWTGQQSIENGLADALGGPASVARDVIGAEQQIDYTPQRKLLERVFERIGAAAVTTWLNYQQSPMSLSASPVTAN